MAEAWELSPCIEWLFAEGGRPFADRVATASEAGFRRVEFWGTGNKELEPLEVAIQESAVTVTAILCEPAATHRDFLAGVETSCQVARRLNARNLIVLAGDADAQTHARLTRALRRSASVAADYGVGLLLEPLNTRVDHPGYFLDSTREGLDVIREVGHPAVKLLYDLYHSVVMGEEPGRVLAGASELVGHLHIADAPGRHEPGTGLIDWPKQLAALRDVGYSGAIGLEYRPTTATEESLAYIRALTGG